MERNTLRALARQAKNRVKNGFWSEQKDELDLRIEIARREGLNESKAGRYFKAKIEETIAGEKKDEFYERVREMLLTEGETGDAIGRLTDKEYYATLSYAEQQRYNLELSNKYLRALERFRKEREFLVAERL